jgi:hypothetical protein
MVSKPFYVMRSFGKKYGQRKRKAYGTYDQKDDLCS